MNGSSPLTACGICIFRNQEDCIERFVRHNLSVLNSLICVNYESRDRSFEILLHLKEEGLPLTILTAKPILESPVQVLRHICTQISTQFDLIVFLEADEFLIEEPEGSFSALLKEWVETQTTGFVPYQLGIPSLEVNSTQPWSIDCVVSSPRSSLKGFYLSTSFPLTGSSESDLFFQPLIRNRPERDLTPDLREIRSQGLSVLTVPCRSVDQVLSQAVPNEMIERLTPQPLSFAPAKWRDLYHCFQYGQELSMDDVLEWAAQWYLHSSLLDCQIVDGPSLARVSHLPCRYPVPSEPSQKDPTVCMTQDILGIAERLEKTRFSYAHTRLGQGEYGVICYDTRDAAIGKSIELYGEWAAEELLLLESFIDPGDVVIDVGANIGVHTLRFAQLVGSGGRVHAFEPQRLVFQKLCATLALNDLSQVVAHPYGLSHQESVIRVNPMSHGNLGGFSILQQQSESGLEDMIIKRLDSMAIPHCDLIKIDVEGMEEWVLRGGEALLQRCRPILFVENNIPAKSQSLLAYVMSMNYDCWWHFAPYYNPKNFYQNPDGNIFIRANRPEINVLCLPQEEHRTVEGLTKISTPEESWWDVYQPEGSAPSP